MLGFSDNLQLYFDWTNPLDVLYCFQLCIDQSTESGLLLKPDVSPNHQVNKSKFDEKKLNGGNDLINNVCAKIYFKDSYDIPSEIFLFW